MNFQIGELSDLEVYPTKEFFDNIVVAVDGQDGLDKYEQDHFDIIITDINMPKLNGIQMIKRIRKNRKVKREFK